jgi:hypothetical protein
LGLGERALFGWLPAQHSLKRRIYHGFAVCLDFSFFCFSDDSEQKVNKGNLRNSKGGQLFLFPLGAGDTMSNVDGRLDWF